MKEIITNYNVESTAENFPKTEFNKDTVYRRFGISRKTKDDGECWVAEKEIQYPKDLYLGMISKENDRLKGDLQKTEQANKMNVLGLIEVNNRLRKLEE